MVINADRSTFPVRSAGGGLTRVAALPEARPITSAAILADAVDVERLLDRRLSARQCGCREVARDGLERLEAWARARPWELPESAVEKADRILRSAERAESTISAAGWCESLPDRILELLERRHPGEAAEGPDGAGRPLRRATDRSAAR